MGKWQHAHVECDYGNLHAYDDLLQSSRNEWGAFSKAFNESPREALGNAIAPGCMKAYNLDSDATFTERWSAYGEAAFDVCLLGAPALFKGATAVRGVESAAVSTVNKGATLSRGAESANAWTNLNQKLSLLEKFQTVADSVKTLPDGRIRYYDVKSLSKNPGPTRCAGNVVEWNPKTTQVRGWYECHDHFGKVNRVHPKNINGQNVTAPHYPPTAKDLIR